MTITMPARNATDPIRSIGLSFEVELSFEAVIDFAMPVHANDVDIRRRVYNCKKGDFDLRQFLGFFLHLSVLFDY